MHQHAAATVVCGDAGDLAATHPHGAFVALGLDPLRVARAHDAVQQRRIHPWHVQQ